MSITVNLYYTGVNGNAKKFVNEMLASGTVEKIRNEKGNLKYEYFYCVENEETVLLIDSWQNQQAIDEHHKTEMMETIMELRKKYNLSVKIERFVSDENGVPEKDMKFIKNNEMKI